MVVAVVLRVEVVEDEDDDESVRLSQGYPLCCWFFGSGTWFSRHRNDFRFSPGGFRAGRRRSLATGIATRTFGALVGHGQGRTAT